MRPPPLVRREEGTGKSYLPTPAHCAYSRTNADDTSHYKGALLEDIRDQLQAVLEGQVSLAGVPQAIADLQTDMNDVKADIKVIKAVVTDQTYELKNQEHRLTRLERRAA